ncbi:MAG TPA: PQQ-binding-like beta-propeller repeat protein [Gemmataceae bacterium]|nr:PQQ-binding-like beta-propeller repeat protein [Gemmataceae bacterium]
MTSPLRILLVALACPALALAGNWPAWRGSTGDGRCTEKDLPLEWNTTKNVRWKVPLPDEGNSTPVVWRNRLFLTQATQRGTHRALLCLDRSNGKQLWKAEVQYKEKEPTHGTNPYCSASPVTDGERVLVSHGSAGLFCYSVEGKELWRKDVGKMIHIWGNASSPILYGDLAILWVGPGDRQILLAVDRRSGKTVWEHNEPGGVDGITNKDWVGSWSTPIIARVGGRDELILSVPLKVKGFDPNSGKELWSCAGLGKLVYTSPVCSAGGIVVAMSGYGGPSLAVRAGGSGDVTKTHRLWQHPSNPQRIGSPVIVGEHAYLINEQGLGQCFELKTGKDVWMKERAASATWGSLVVAGDRFYITTQNGETVILSASPEFKVLGRNRLNETTRASVAVSDGELFIRTYKHLWCISKKQ